MSNPQIEVLLPIALGDLEIRAINLWLATVCKSVICRRPFERRNQRHAEMLPCMKMVFLYVDNPSSLESAQLQN